MLICFYQKQKENDMSYAKRTEALRAAIKKLSLEYKKSPEADLLFAIIAKAIEDLEFPSRSESRHRINFDSMTPYETAIDFLYGSPSIQHADIIGLETAYIRRVIAACLNHFGESPLVKDAPTEYKAKTLKRAMGGD